jgi:hypothetical protein
VTNGISNPRVFSKNDIFLPSSRDLTTELSTFPLSQCYMSHGQAFYLHTITAANAAAAMLQAFIRNKKLIVNILIIFKYFNITYQHRFLLDNPSTELFLI